MGASKTELHSTQHIRIAEIAKVLSHPARVAIMEHIASQQDCICSDLVEEIGLSQPTISQHLQVIRNAGLLKGNFEGKRLCYCLDAERLQEIQSLFNNFFNTSSANCCTL